MMSCKKSSGLLEKQQVEGLSLSERWSLWLHMTICKGCQHWKKDSQQLDSAIQYLHQKEQMESDVNLSEQVRDKIKNQFSS